MSNDENNGLKLASQLAAEAIAPYNKIFEPKPAAGGYCAPLFGHSITVEWSEPKVGFGQFVFTTDEDGTVYCDNEMMSKEFIKMKLCQMVDSCVVTLPRGE